MGISWAGTCHGSALTGFDLGKMTFDVTKKAEGAAGAGIAPPLAIGAQGFFVFVRGQGGQVLGAFANSHVAFDSSWDGHGHGAINCGCSS